MRITYVCAAVPLALALCASTASAATVDVSGFGTAGFVITDTNEAEFVRGSQGVGANSSGDVGVDSVAGLQATVHLNDRISGTVQMMLRRQLANKGFETDASLAFLKLDVTPEFAIRVGRVALPIFMVSDFRLVGYANTWLRAPVEVYGQSPFDSVDGFDMLFSRNVGALSLTGQAFWGKTDISLAAVDVKVRDFWGVNLSAALGPLTLRAGRVNQKYSLIGLTAVDQLIAGIRAAGFAALADDLSATDKPAEFTAYGAVLDWRNVLVQAELTEADTSGYPASTRSSYGLLGYRIDKFTPYAMYSKREVVGARTSTVIPQVGALIPLAGGVNALIKGVEQSTTSAGLRWDAYSSLAVKFQYDHVKPEAGTAGLLINAQPGFSGNVNVFGIAVDVVF